MTSANSSSWRNAICTENTFLLYDIPSYTCLASFNRFFSSFNFYSVRNTRSDSYKFAPGMRNIATTWPADHIQYSISCIVEFTSTCPHTVNNNNNNNVEKHVESDRKKKLTACHMPHACYCVEKQCTTNNRRPCDTSVIAMR